MSFPRTFVSFTGLDPKGAAVSLGPTIGFGKADVTWKYSDYEGMTNATNTKRM